MGLQASGKKIGRPLTDSGNPDQPGLREDERRRIRRRMANRESARRVRERRVEAKVKMEAKVRPSLQSCSSSATCVSSAGGRSPGMCTLWPNSCLPVSVAVSIR